MFTDPFAATIDSPIAPAELCFPITPDDVAHLLHATKGIYVGESGDVVLRTVRNDFDVTFRNVPAGAILDVRAYAVRNTGTTAGSLVGMA